MRRNSIKTLKVQKTLETVQSMRKQLIEASRQAMLTADELEDAAFSGNVEGIASMAGNDADIKAAQDACHKISEHIKAAIELSKEAKEALRGYPYRDTEQYEGKSLSARRHLARRRMRR